MILMGRVGAAHGIRGEVRLQSFTADPAAILDFSPLATDRDGLTVTLISVRPHKNMLVAKIEGVTDRNGAEALNGVELFAPRDALPAEAEEDEFYHADLIGLTARTPDGAELGMLTAIHDFGAGDILEIVPSRGKALMVPFTRAAVPAIDFDAGSVTIILPEEVDGGDRDDSGTGET